MPIRKSGLVILYQTSKILLFLITEKRVYWSYTLFSRKRRHQGGLDQQRSSGGGSSQDRYVRKCTNLCAETGMKSSCAVVNGLTGRVPQITSNHFHSGILDFMLSIRCVLTTPNFPFDAQTVWCWRPNIPFQLITWHAPAIL